MKYIFVNLKRFDIGPEYGGVNRLAPSAKWAETIVKNVGPGLEKLLNDGSKAVFTFFFPEAHVIAAAGAKGNFPVLVGCQGVHWDDTAPGGNFGAFTTSKPAAATLPELSASTRASLLMVGPRDVLTMITPSFIRAKSALSRM